MPESKEKAKFAKFKMALAALHPVTDGHSYFEHAGSGFFSGRNADKYTLSGEGRSLAHRRCVNDCLRIWRYLASDSRRGGRGLNALYWMLFNGVVL